MCRCDVWSPQASSSIGRCHWLCTSLSCRRLRCQSARSRRRCRSALSKTESVSMFVAVTAMALLTAVGHELGDKPHNSLVDFERWIHRRQRALDGLRALVGVANDIRHCLLALRLLFDASWQSGVTKRIYASLKSPKRANVHDPRWKPFVASIG